MIEIVPESAENAYLKTAGEFGAGTEFGGDATLVFIKLLATPGEGPGFDKDCEKDNYLRFGVRIVHPEFGSCFATAEPGITTKNTGSSAIEWLRNVGVDLHSGENGNLLFDEDTALPEGGVKVKVRVGKPRQSQAGRWFTGNIFQMETV